MTEEKRPVFGSRHLSDQQDVFSHNAWDDVEWSEEQSEEANAVIDKQLKNKMTNEKWEKLKNELSNSWNQFYSVHEHKFFKDRQWLFTEFPELLLTPSNKNEKFNILETGCGVGNCVFPILRTNDLVKTNLFIYCCDYSSEAIDLLSKNECFDSQYCKPFVYDLTVIDSNEMPFEENSLDIILMIFVLSAIEPSKFEDVLKNLCKYLKPNGKLLFRDYGLYDMAQLRFKHDKCVAKNLYARQDGTLVYFFTQDELDSLFQKCGLVKQQNMIDRRLQINRSKQIKMYRIWIQAIYVKNSPAAVINE